MKTPPITLRQRRLSASLLTLWLILSPTGLVGAAVQPVVYTHNANSTLRGDTGITLSSGADLILAANLDTLGLLKLTAAGTLTNNATQVGRDLLLTATSLDNHGILAAANDLTANISGRLTNRSNALLVAGNDARLYVDELLNEEDGSIYTGGNLLIQKDALGNSATRITNQTGSIEAAGDLTIRTGILTNQGRSPAVLTRTSSDAVPYTITSCSDAGDPGCVDSGSVNGNGETIWNSAWGFRTATVGEVRDYFSRNPRAPTSDPYLHTYAPSFLDLVTAHRADPHGRSNGPGSILEFIEAIKSRVSIIKRNNPTSMDGTK